MNQLKPLDIVDEVRSVLIAAHRGKGIRPNFLTSYQILARLSETTRSQLISERSSGGAGAGIVFGGPSVVSRAAMRIPGVVIEYMDSVGLSIDVAGDRIVPSNEVCGLFRLEVIDESVE
jgi:hypothetical protein